MGRVGLLGSDGCEDENGRCGRRDLTLVQRYMIGLSRYCKRRKEEEKKQALNRQQPCQAGRAYIYHLVSRQITLMRGGEHDRKLVSSPVHRPIGPCIPAV